MTVWFDTGIKAGLTGEMVLDGTTHVIRAVAVDRDAIETLEGIDESLTGDELEAEVDSRLRVLQFASALESAFIGTPVDISANLSLDAASGEIRCSPITLGQLSGNDSEYLLVFRDTGDLATSPMLTVQDVAIHPNGASIWGVRLEGDKLLGYAAAGLFPRTLGKLFSGAESLSGATLNVQLLTAAPAYTEEFRSAVGNAVAPLVSVSGFLLADAEAALVPDEASSVFSAVTGTLSHVLLSIDKGSAAADLPLGTMQISPALTLTDGEYTLTYPAEGALRFAAVA